jgi:hypothetical protein
MPPIAATTNDPSASLRTNNAAHGEHGRPVGHEGGRVAEQRLALDERDDDARRTRPAGRPMSRRAHRSGR